MNRDVARLLLLGASAASLVAVGFALGLARHERGAERVLLVSMAAFTLFVSWTVVNTVFTLRYARLYYLGASDGIDFGERDRPPDYRDFAYLAFTIGMTYQVSDTTLHARRDPAGGALPRVPVLRLRRGDRGRGGQRPRRALRLRELAI